MSEIATQTQETASHTEQSETKAISEHPPQHATTTSTELPIDIVRQSIEPVQQQKEEISTLNPKFLLDKYTFRRKVFRMFGGAYDVYDAKGKPVLYSTQDRFRLKEKFHIYTDKKKKN